MIGGPNPFANNTLASIYNANTTAIAAAMARIASGKRIQAPGDDFAGFARASALQSDVAEYQQVKQNLQDIKGFTDYAAGVGNNIVSDLDRLKELQSLYTTSGDPVAQASYKAEYDATVLRIADTKSDSYYDDIKVYQSGVSLKSVGVNPENSSLSVTVTASAVGNEAAISNIASVLPADIQAEINNAQVYVASMKSFGTIFQRDLNLADTIISSKQATLSAITDINDVEEITALTALQIRQQATASMLAQANIAQGFAAQLYGGIK
jgi:flagellin-like hook-associated protein FlgL